MIVPYHPRLEPSILALTVSPLRREWLLPSDLQRPLVTHGPQYPWRHCPVTDRRWNCLILSEQCPSVRRVPYFCVALRFTEERADSKLTVFDLVVPAVLQESHSGSRGARSRMREPG